MDDLTSNMSSNGKTLLSNSVGGSQIKSSINFLSFIYGVKQLKSPISNPQPTTTEPIDNIISTIGDSKSVHDDVTKKENKQ